jgi:hypothetical protein
MRSLLLTLSLGFALGATAHAGPLFSWRKAEKPDPKVRVPELIQILKSDKDEIKRSNAAVELRQYDAAAFPDMVPALINALFTDTRAGVRIDAAQTLSKIRPLSQTVGEALEQAMEKDVSMRVRLQARSSLLSYQWAGYRGGKKPESGPAVVTVPAPVNRPAPTPVTAPAPEKRMGFGSLFMPSLRTAPTPSRGGNTGEPPLAPPVAPSVGPAPTGNSLDKGPLLPPVTPPAITPVPPARPQPTTPPTTPTTPPVEGPILP